jgi:DNA-binding CsgD family transcriptional regulator
MLSSGKSVIQIVEALDLSPTTVSTDRARLLEKMEPTTAELIR